MVNVPKTTPPKLLVNAVSSRLAVLQMKQASFFFGEDIGYRLPHSTQYTKSSIEISYQRFRPADLLGFGASSISVLVWSSIGS
jgi:hypothetical protein